MAVEVIEATEAVEAVEVIEASEVLRSGKSLLRTSMSSRFLNSALLWGFEGKNVFGRIMKYHVEFSNFSVGGCWKLVNKTQVYKPPGPTRHHYSIKLLILLPLIAFYFRSFFYGTPFNNKWSYIFLRIKNFENNKT